MLQSFSRRVAAATGTALSRTAPSKCITSSALFASMRAASPHTRCITRITASSASAAVSLRPHPQRSVSQQTTGQIQDWATREAGSPATESWRLFFHAKSDPAKQISPWHDIPLLANPSSASPSSSSSRIYHYVNEIPLHTTAKMEVSTGSAHNPIAQDIKKGKLRHFTYGTIPFNYGCLPQTWEDPTVSHHDTQCVGDNDPLDVVELSQTPLPIGAVSTVRILGVFALIDEGETDWKLLAIRLDAPEAARLQTAEDVERLWPGRLQKVKDWFKYYKTTDGKPENRIAYDEKVLGIKEAEAIVQETHGHWKKLRDRGADDKKKLWLK